MLGTIGWLAGVGFLAHTVEAALGFGGTVIALALGAHLLPLDLLLAPLVLLTLVQALWRVSRDARHVRWDVLGAHVLPLAGAGMAIGALLARAAPPEGLKLVLGAFVAVVAALELWRLARPAAQAAPRELPASAAFPLLVAGGVFHGLFATGGPLVVYYASRRIPEPMQFRATLAALWLVLNAVLGTVLFAQGKVDPRHLVLFGALLPSLALGSLAGNALRLEPRRFRALTYALLFVSGVLLLLR